MKRAMSFVVITAFIAGFAGCGQTRQVLYAIDRAKSFTYDIEKQAQDKSEKAFGLIPGDTGARLG